MVSRQEEASGNRSSGGAEGRDVLFDLKVQDDEEEPMLMTRAPLKRMSRRIIHTSVQRPVIFLNLTTEQEEDLLLETSISDEAYLSGITTTRGILKVSVEAGGDSDR